MLLVIFEILAIIGIVASLSYRHPIMYAATVITQIACVITIIASDDNPDYKIPWLLFVIILLQVLLYQ